LMLIWITAWLCHLVLELQIISVEFITLWAELRLVFRVIEISSESAYQDKFIWLNKSLHAKDAKTAVQLRYIFRLAIINSRCMKGLQVRMSVHVGWETVKNRKEKKKWLRVREFRAVFLQHWNRTSTSKWSRFRGAAVVEWNLCD